MRYSLQDIRDNFAANAEHVFWKKSRKIVLETPNKAIAMMGALVKTASNKLGVTALDQVTGSNDQMGLQRLMGLAERQMKEHDVIMWKRAPEEEPDHPERTGIFFSKKGEIAYWVSWPMAEDREKGLIMTLPDSFATDHKRRQYFLLTNVPS